MVCSREGTGVEHKNLCLLLPVFYLYLNKPLLSYGFTGDSLVIFWSLQHLEWILLGDGQTETLSTLLRLSSFQRIWDNLRSLGLFSGLHFSNSLYSARRFRQLNYACIYWSSMTYFFVESSISSKALIETLGIRLNLVRLKIFLLGFCKTSALVSYLRHLQPQHQI